MININYEIHEVYELIQWISSLIKDLFLPNRNSFNYSNNRVHGSAGEYLNSKL